AYPENPSLNADKTWERLQSRARTGVDPQGSPVLQLRVGENWVQVGDSAENVFAENAPPQLVRQLLEARLQSELSHRSPQGVTETEVARDWKLLQQTLPENVRSLSARSSQTLRGNRQ